MAKPTLPELFLKLASAQKPGDRKNVLYQATSLLAGRFDEEQIQQLRRLSAEQVVERALRPLQAVTDCKHLETLKHGPRPVLPDDIWQQVNEWVEGWRRAEELRFAGISPPGPMLLFGQTGCGKTMLTSAIAAALSERQAAVLDAHRLIDSHLGVTGNNLSKTFETCAQSGSLLVIEELDAFSGKRTGSGGPEQENARITVAFMRLMDGADFPIIATTNRPDIIDPAQSRRFEAKIEIPAPDELKRFEIITAALGARPPEAWLEMPLAESLSLVKAERRRRYLAEHPVEPYAADG